MYLLHFFKGTSNKNATTNLTNQFVQFPQIIDDQMLIAFICLIQQ